MANMQGNKMDKPEKSGEFRIVEFGGGWEPQMSFTAGMVKGVFWYPLNPEGYWLQPGAFTDGNPTWRISLPKADAERAIVRASAIENGPARLLTATEAE